MSPGAWILVATVVLALAFGAWRAATDGRFRGTRRLADARPAQEQPSDRPAQPQPAEAPPAGDSVLAGFGLDVELGERATLLQFSSAFCAPCRATRRVLGDVAAAVPGVTHVEVDAEEHLDLVRRAGVVRTPTTLVLDAAGREMTRAAGAPRKEQVLAALALGDPT